MAILIVQLLQSRLGVAAHRADFIHFELAPVLPDSGLSEENRTAILQFDQDGN